MPKCKACGAEDVEVGGCFECMVEGCEKCIHEKSWVNPKLKSCKGCGDVRRLHGLKAMVGMQCALCRATAEERSWVLWHSYLDWADDGDLLYKYEPICDECLMKRHEISHKRFEEVHGHPVSYYRDKEKRNGC